VVGGSDEAVGGWPSLAVGCRCAIVESFSHVVT
jgi:hypothetical protein